MGKGEPIPQIDWLSAQEIRRLRRTLETLIDELGVDASLQLMSFMIVALAEEMKSGLGPGRGKRNATGFSKRLVERVVDAIFPAADLGSGLIDRSRR